MEVQIKAKPSKNPLMYIGYTPITTFWEDFSIADGFGISSIKDTYTRAFNEWKGYYKYLTELAMVLNHKSWEHYDYDNIQISETYVELFRKVHEYALNTLKGDELQYYLSTTD